MLTLYIHIGYKNAMKLRAWRLERNWSLAMLAERAGIRHRMTVSRYERDPDDPNFRFPCKANLRKLTTLTEGAVTANDYLAPGGAGASERAA